MLRSAFCKPKLSDFSGFVGNWIGFSGRFASRCRFQRNKFDREISSQKMNLSRFARSKKFPKNELASARFRANEWQFSNMTAKFPPISNVCQHQNGPLGEGEIIDGCITCPWHGFQYHARNWRISASIYRKSSDF